MLGTGIVTTSLADSSAPGEADEAAFLDEKTSPEEVARRLREAAKTGGRALHHSKAVAGNTRGFRMAKAGQCDAALPILEAAAALDPKYGMPRYSAARCYAQKEDAVACVRKLKELQALGAPQLFRLAQAKTDEGFARVAANPAFKAVLQFSPADQIRLERASLYMASAPLPAGLWRAFLRSGAKWSLPNVEDGRDDDPRAMIVQVQKLRKVGAINVVSLGYSYKWGKKVEKISAENLPSMLAISDQGVCLMAGTIKDDKVIGAEKREPVFSEPPSFVEANSRRDGLFVFAPPSRPGAVCFGWGAMSSDPDEPGCGSAPCCSWMCLDATGVVGAGGTDEKDSMFGVDVPIPCG